MRKKILSNIGEDLMVVSKDQPFRFPAEFTFVVVRFSFLFSFLFSFSFSFVAVKKKSSRILCISETSRRC